MAYMSQEKKAKLAPVIKAILKKHGMKGSIGVQHHSTLVVNLTEGRLDLIGNANRLSHEYERRTGNFVNINDKYIQVNEYRLKDDFDGECREFLIALREAMNDGNHNNSVPQVDHFDIGWYIDINIGRWDKPYICNCTVTA